MEPRPETIAVIGCGTLGSTLLGALLGRGLVRPGHLRATVRSATSVARVRAELAIEVGTDNVTAVRSSDVVVLAVKPQAIGQVCGAPELARASASKLVISVAAGVGLGQLASLLPEARLIRAMPNTPARVGEGLTVIAPGPTASADDLALARRTFAALGRVLELDEAHMDAVTALGASGPAFAYLLIEAMAEGGVMMGLGRAAAREIAAQVFRGAGTMVLETGAHPAALRDEVTTPAGCTIAGLLALEDGKVRSVVARAVQTAAVAACQLGSRAAPDGAEPPYRP